MKDYMKEIDAALSERRGKENELDLTLSNYAEELEKLDEELKHIDDFDVFRDKKFRADFIRARMEVTRKELEKLSKLPVPADMIEKAWSEVLADYEKTAEAVRADFKADYDKMKNDYQEHKADLEKLGRIVARLKKMDDQRFYAKPAFDSTIGLYIDRGGALRHSYGA